MNKSNQKRQALFTDNFIKVSEGMTRQHRRVLPVRIDLRFPQGYVHDGKNSEISQFHKNIHQYYGDKKIDVRYHTVREQVSSETPHYHVILLMDGDKVQSAYTVKKRCENIWNNILNHKGIGLADYCKPKPGYPHEPLRMIRRPSQKASGPELARQVQEFEEAKTILHQHAAYLNKATGKGKAPYRVREVFTSQIRT